MQFFKKILRYCGYIIFRPIWWLEYFVPRSKRICVFGAWYGQKYSDNSKWLYEYILQHKPEIKSIWITKNRDVYNMLRTTGKPVYMSKSLKGIWFCLRAKYIFITSTQNDVNKYFLNGSKQIWLWHGMPLKKIVYCGDYANISIFQKLFNPYEAVKPYATITSSDYFTSYLQAAFRLPKERIWGTGLPRCDVFFTKMRESFVNSIREKIKKVKIFLYMPTFRMQSNMEGTPFSPFLKRFGFNEVEFINFLEEQNIFFLYKPHYVDASVKIEINSPRFLYINDKDFDDLYVLLNSVDVLLTDYSSVYFDFLATNKQIFLLVFDYEEYTNNSRAHFFNMYNEMHGNFCYDWNDFYQKVSKSDFLLTSLEDDRNKFASYLNGQSCESIFKLLEY